MASKTQIKLSQLTGSMPSSSTSAASASAVVNSDLSGVLDHLGSAIARITGTTSFSESAAGEFSSSLVPSSDGGANLGSSSKEWAQVHTNRIDSAAALDVNVTTGITVDATTVSIDGTDDSNLSMAGNASGNKTLTIAASNSGSGSGLIDMDADGAITIDAGGALSLDAAAASNLSTSAGDLTLEAGGSSNKVVVKGDSTSGVAIHLDANEGSSSEIHMEAGVIDMDATGAATLDAGGSITLTGAGVLLAGGSSEVDITTSGAFDVNVGSVDLDSSAGIAIDGTTVSIDGTDSSNFTMTGNSSSAVTMTIAASNSGSGAGVIDMDADGAITVDAGAGLSLQGGAASDLTVSSGDLSLVADGSSNKVVIKGDHASGVAIHLDANEGSSSEIHMEAGVLDMDATGAATLDAGGAIGITGAGVDINAGSGTLELTSSGAVDVNSAAFTLDGSTISLDASDDSNFSLAGNSSSDVQLSFAASNSGSGAGNMALSADTVTITGNLTVAGTTTTVNAQNLLVADHNIVLDRDNSTSAVVDGAGITMEGGSGDDITLQQAASADRLELKKGSSFHSLAIGNLVANGTTIDIDGSTSVTLDTATLSLDGTDSTNLTMTANSSSAKTLTIAASNSGSEKGSIDMDADGTIDIDAASGINIGKAADVAFDVDSAAFDLDASGAITIDGTSTLSLDAADDTNLSMAANSSSDKTLTLAASNSGSGSGLVSVTGDTITLDSAGDVVLDADGDNITMKAGSDAADGLDFSWDNSGSLWTIASKESGSGIVLGAKGSSSVIEALRIVAEGSSSVYARMPSGVQLQFADTGETISGNGTDLTIASGGDVVLSATTAVRPGSNDGASLGESAIAWSDLFLASEAVINFSAGDVTLTHGQDLGSDNFSSLVQSKVDSSSLVSGSGNIQFSSESTAQAFVAEYGSGSVVRFATSSGAMLVTLSSYGGSGANVPYGSTSGDSFLSFSSINSVRGVTRSKLTATDSLDLSGHDGSNNGLMLGGSLVKATATEMNLLDGGTSVGSSITIVDADGMIINDGGTMKSIPMSDLKTYVGGGRTKKTATQSSAVSAGQVVTVSGMSHDLGADPDLSDIYLNGQLMLSGSSSSSGDYRINGTGPDSSLSLGGVGLNSATFSTSTTSVAFDGALASAASSFSAGKILVMENSGGTIRFEGTIASSAGSSDTSLSLTAGTVRLFNPVSGAAVSSASSSAFVGSSAIKTADPLTVDDVIFFFALEADDVVTIVTV